MLTNKTYDDLTTKMLTKKEKGKNKEVKEGRISAWRLRRLFFHTCLGLIIILLSLAWYERIRWFLFFVLITGVIISIISLRYRIPFIYYMLKKFEKPQYFHRFPGKNVLFFIAGCLLVLRLFSQPIALASIAILTFADPVSFLIGSYGKVRYMKKPFDKLKNIEGTIAGVVVAFISASIFVPLLYALIAAVISMLAEAIVIRIGEDMLDDNLLVPLVAGTVLTICKALI